ATVRPETIMGDTAVCVHPRDERYQHLHGHYVFVPLINRRIPIITDEYVSMDFGTGALKITPAHDMNDNMLGQKHNLEIVDILNEDGTLNEEAQLFIGEDRFEARKKIVKELDEKGFLVKTEDYTSEVGYSERTESVVEPRLSLQWWVDMKKIHGPALKAVVEDEIKFYPPKFKNLYRHWMENIKDWCISRQLWWGHRIPAWYAPDGAYVVAATREEAFEKLKAEWDLKKGAFPKDLTIDNIRQDEDCLDTWFSSWLWPFEVFKGYSNPGNPDVNYYYPTNTLVTAPEIIFFWVARMIMAGYEYKSEKPFREVYFTGIVRDKQGRKMSKSLGNSPDLLALIDKYGADAVRFGIMIASPAGNDLLWDESSNEQGLHFNNKIWNALKLVKMWKGRQVVDKGKPATNNFAVQWFENRLRQSRMEIDESYKDFRLSEILKTIYSLIWDDFCSWYLEWVKPGFEQPIDKDVYEKTVDFFEQLMQLLHPFMPFITEEVYHQLRERKDDIVIRQLDAVSQPDQASLQSGIILKEVITAIRDARVKAQLKPKDPVNLHIMTSDEKVYHPIETILAKQVNSETVKYTRNPVNNSITVVVQKDKFFLETTTVLDLSSQKEQMQKDLEYLKGFLVSVEKKLSNEKFVNNAKPEVVDVERKKKADAEARIRIIEEELGVIKK
ncbi:MAG TPA: valine--tRNA ligase, partial [Chitinophagaceae bacterium]|nr:valine--tRNA ligase [Chitinophagaceae bacterium]